jgi:UDP-N-acetylglucosamine 4,6-dehydratase
LFVPLDWGKVLSVAHWPRKVLITGAGTLGTALVHELLNMGAEEIRVLDISEDSLWRLEEDIKHRKVTEAPGTIVKLFLGDVRDMERMRLAMKGCDTIYHTAALKHVKYTNYNPIECIRTNVDAVGNLVVLAVESPDVVSFCNMSSDKAALPNNIYGDSKRTGERLTTWGWRISGRNFFSVRSGNFIGSRGSVLERWEKQGPFIELTDERMNRFFITPREIAKYITTLSTMSPQQTGGCVCTPFLKNFSMKTIADVILSHWKERNPNSSLIPDIKIIGAQEGEKLDEMIISDEEATRTIQTDELGWWTKPTTVDDPVLGAITTAVVPTMNYKETEEFLSRIVGWYLKGEEA